MIDPYQLAAAAAADAQRAEALVQARIAAMPYQLRAFPNWGFYRADKAPRSATGAKFSINDPSTWVPFDVLRNSSIPSQCIGPTFVLTQSLNLTVIDLDNPERAYANADHLTPERKQFLIDAANEWTKRILQWAVACGAWIERSNSGRGWHIFVFGTTPEAKYAIGPFGHIYRVGHVHMTGDVHPQSASAIPHAQAALDELITFALSRVLIKPIAVNAGGDDAPVCELNGRRIDLTDSQCVEALSSFGRRLFNGETPRNWSDDTYLLILDLDKITGNPNQIWRVLASSPRMRNAGTAANGADRFVRTQDQFGVMLAKARAKNDERSALYECIDGVWQLRTGAAFDATLVKPRAV
ncbi:hypothetical protein [Mesorhizobium sp.]|uniref:hypothetical protein n=1 Tax=Mesorhizobium sp. TaxID=1871066 RepID=UPI000FE516B3|nr:hypothetical protein [Mesorhizobium sp.]RWE86942.1 MAG: hypothetical protein EOS49_11810 [Mesorhizobium sp.]